MPDVVNLPNIATQLGAALGIGDFGGGLLMTSITLALFLLPMLMVCNKWKMDSTWPTMITGFLVLAFSIYAYALPVWILLMEVLLVALFLANTMRNFVSKGG
jgi:hypothetical protein